MREEHPDRIIDTFGLICDDEFYQTGQNTFIGEYHGDFVKEWRGPAEIRENPVNGSIEVYADPDERGYTLFGHRVDGIDVAHIKASEKDRYRALMPLPYRTTVHFARHQRDVRMRLGGGVPLAREWPERRTARSRLAEAAAAGIPVDPADTAAVDDPDTPFTVVHDIIDRTEKALGWDSSVIPPYIYTTRPVGAITSDGWALTGHGWVRDPDAPMPEKRWLGPPFEEAWIYDIGDIAGGYVVNESHRWESLVFRPDLRPPEPEPEPEPVAPPRWRRIIDRLRSSLPSRSREPTQT